MDVLNTQFVGSFELRQSLPLLLEQIQKKGDGFVVTNKGKPVAMLISVKSYLEIKTLNEELEDAMRDLADKAYMKELDEARSGIVAGKGKDAKKVFKSLGI